MKNREVLKFISKNIKGCKSKIAILSITQVLIGALTVGFSFMLKFVISAIEVPDKNLLTRNIIIIACIALALILLTIFYRIYYEISYVDIENKLKKNFYLKQS